MSKLRDWPKHPDDKIDYDQEQRHGVVEIFVTLRLPVNCYEAAARLSRINDYKSFDDYVSHYVMNDLEMMAQGEVADDLVISKITDKNSPWMQNVKETFGPINKRLKEQAKIEREAKRRQDYGI